MKSRRAVSRLRGCLLARVYKALDTHARTLDRFIIKEARGFCSRYVPVDRSIAHREQEVPCTVVVQVRGPSDTTTGREPSWQRCFNVSITPSLRLFWVIGAEQGFSMPLHARTIHYNVHLYHAGTIKRTRVHSRI